MAWLKHDPEVLVVGAGPVGLFAALECARRGMRVRVIDEQWRTTSRSYALSLHPRSIELLDAHGLAEDLIAQGQRVEATVFCDRKGERARVKFSDLGVKYPFLLILPQHALEAGLERKLEEHKIRVEWNHRVVGLQDDGSKVAVRVQRLGKESVGYAAALTEWVVEKEFGIDASFVLGTDGHRSAVRRSAGIGYDEAGRQQLFAVFEFQADGAPIPESRVVLDDDTTNVLWSMKDGRFRWGFQLTDPSAAEDPRAKSRLLVGFDAGAYPAIDPASLHDFVAQRAPWFTPRVTEVFWSAAIRFERRLAERFGQGRVWLAGDSAHLAGPVGMHSMNVGLREARDLAWCVSQRHSGTPVEDPLGGYASARRREWMQLLGLEATPSVRPGADPWVRERAARILECTPSSGSALRGLLAQIGIEIELETEWVASV